MHQCFKRKMPRLKRQVYSIEIQKKLIVMIRDGSVLKESSITVSVHDADTGSRCFESKY